MPGSVSRSLKMKGFTTTNWLSIAPRFRIRKEFRDFDVWVRAGGPLKAYIETVPVDVTDGKIKITFTPKVENPQICAIEIIPQF